MNWLELPKYFLQRSKLGVYGVVLLETIYM